MAQIAKCRISRRRWLLGAALALPAVSAADAFCIEPHWVRTRTVRLSTAVPTHRIVHITDVHHKGDRAYLERVVNRVNQLSPDFVCFTGDLVEEEAHAAEALTILKGIRSPVFGVPGNHDHASRTPTSVFAEGFAATGGRWLVNEAVSTPDGRVRILGVDRPPRFKAGTPHTTNILLMHYPLWVESVPPLRFDLILAGHSHGGQVRIPGWGAIVLPRYVGPYELGLFHTKAGPLYVNPGIGSLFTSIRFCCRPEITVFEI